MEILNRSVLGMDDLRRWCVFAKDGLHLGRVIVVVDMKPAGQSLLGVAYGPHEVVLVARQMRLKDPDCSGVVRLWVPAGHEIRDKWCFSGLRTLMGWYPDGVPIESLEDYMVALAAHEFRHIWQFQTAKMNAMMGLKPTKRYGELDAEKWAIARLNALRVSTGRAAVEAQKRPRQKTSTVPPASRPFMVAFDLFARGYRTNYATGMVGKSLAWTEDPQAAKVYSHNLSASVWGRMRRSIPAGALALRTVLVPGGECVQSRSA